MATRKPTTADPTPAPAWCLQLLGAPRLVRAQPADEITLSANDAALLALVALEGPINTERVAMWVWPGVDARRAVTSLRQRLFRLRRRSTATLIVSGAQLQAAADLRTDWADNLALLAEDPEAARAELLGDLSFDDTTDLAAWLQSVRTRWHEQRIAALAAAASDCEATGAVVRGLAYAQRLSEAQPLSEHAQRRLMRLHYLRGDHSAAIAAFERFEQTLKNELGAQPSAETLELLATVERGAVTLPTHRAVVPASLMRPPRMVGRGAELAALWHAWASRRAFVLLGEAGIGKTRCLQEFGNGCEGLVSVQARPGDAAIAYAVLARLMRAILARNAGVPDGERRRELALVLPELGEAVARVGEAQRLLLLRAVEATLADAAAQGLRAVLVDDLHFADDASLEFLPSLLQSPALAGLLWGFAQRPGERGSSIAGAAGASTPPWHAALEQSLGLDGITLGPLNGAQVQELLASLALPELDVHRLAPALLKHTGGNPMFALETLKHMVLDGAPSAAGRLPRPTSVGALVEQRLGRLSPAALKLARTAALAGASFSAELAAAVMDAHPLDIAEPWRELEAAQVLRDGAFAHDLIFEAARASVPEPIARLLQARIAQHLQARGAQPASVAPHWAGAQQWALAGQAYALAARHAQSASQRGHEVEHWRQAERCYDAAGDSQRSFEMRCESIEALIVVHGVSHATRLIATLLAQACTDAQRCAALTARAMASLMAGDHRSAVADAVQAGALAARFESPWPRFEAARLHAVGLAQGGRAVEGLAVIAPFRDAVERDGTRQQKGHFWSDYAYVLNTAQRLRETGLALDRAITNAQEMGDLAELATLISNMATVQGNLGHVDQALELAQRGLALQVQLGTTGGPAGGVVETYVGLYSAMLGRYEQALERLDAALACFERDGQTLWIALASNHKAACLIDLGQFARARQALAYAAPPVDGVRARGATLAARVELALGRTGKAALNDALAIVATGGDAYNRMLTRLEEAEQLEPQAAVARCQEVQRWAGELEYAGVAMKAGLLAAQALHRAGSGAAAAASLHELLARLDSVQPADMYLPQAWWIAAQVFSGQGEVEEATLALSRGARWIRQVALPHVPEAFRDSFLHRNPVNRALLAATSARLA